MLKKVCLYGLLLVSCAVQAQLTDSISVNSNSFYHSIEQELHEWPLMYTRAKLNNFTETSIRFQHKDLELKHVQTPEITNNYQFATNGIFNFSERLRVFGSFRYTKSFEKALAYNLSAERTEKQLVLPPNYFFAPKKGDWKNDYFEINGGLSYQLPANFLIGGVFHYNNRSAYRTIDPRPGIKISDYAIALHAGYRLQNHSLFIKAGLGRKTTTAGIMYVDGSQNAPVFTETFTRFSTGYGRVVFNSSYPDYLRKAIPKTFGAGYSFQQNNQRFSVQYGYQKGIDNFYSSDGNNNVYFDEELITYKYRKISHKIAADYYNDGVDWNYRLHMGYNQEVGDNYSVIDQGQNFRYNLKSYDVEAAILNERNKRVLLAAHIKAKYTKRSYIDLLGYTNKKIRVLQLQTRLNRDLWDNESHKLNIGINMKLYLPIEERLVLRTVTSDTSFTENVIVPDHAYDVSTRLLTGIVANFTFKLSNSKSLRFFATYHRLALLNDAYKTYYPVMAGQFSQYINTGIVITY